MFREKIDRINDSTIISWSESTLFAKAYHYLALLRYLHKQYIKII